MKFITQKTHGLLMKENRAKHRAAVISRTTESTKVFFLPILLIKQTTTGE
jgi:hypothetical protein